MGGSPPDQEGKCRTATAVVKRHGGGLKDLPVTIIQAFRFGYARPSSAEEGSETSNLQCPLSKVTDSRGVFTINRKEP